MAFDRDEFADIWNLESLNISNNKLMLIHPDNTRLNIRAAWKLKLLDLSNNKLDW